MEGNAKVTLRRIHMCHSLFWGAEVCQASLTQVSAKGPTPRLVTVGNRSWMDTKHFVLSWSVWGWWQRPQWAHMETQVLLCSIM